MNATIPANSVELMLDAAALDAHYCANDLRNALNDADQVSGIVILALIADAERLHQRIAELHAALTKGIFPYRRRDRNHEEQS